MDARQIQILVARLDLWLCQNEYWLKLAAVTVVVVALLLPFIMADD